MCAKNAPDNLQDLCAWSFTEGFRVAGGFQSSNPIITQMCEVECPSELWQAVGYHRLDSSNKGYTCPANVGVNLGGRLSRTQDCAKPSYAWGGAQGQLDPLNSVIIPCRRDGYTRVNVPTAPSTPAPTPTALLGGPTAPSTVRPTNEPTYEVTTVPTIAPTQSKLCCAETPYADWVWPYCKNAADKSANKNVTTCDACMSYQCLDWMVLSHGMTVREQQYFNRTNGDSVYFGVGSYGNDPSRAGLCYRISATGVDRDLIVQVITQGGPSPGGDFNILMADGGFPDDYNACVAEGTSIPQFGGSSSAWGGPRGGWLTPNQCQKLPKYPLCGGTHQDNIQDLCYRSFATGLRLTVPNNTNPVITKMCNVQCPVELWKATGFHRNDELSKEYTCGATNLEPTGGLLSHSMDCAKPSYGWGIPAGVTANTSKGYDRVIPCRRDGYTRVSYVPTPAPTPVPSFAPTSNTSLCCTDTVYPDWVWPYCTNGAQLQSTSVTSCESQCVAYQCIDWNVLSAGMQQRQAIYQQETRDLVYFGVGSYGADQSRAGYCYRITAQGIDRDLIVQVITEGGKTAPGTFNLIMADGGFTDQYSACTTEGTPVPQFPGVAKQWGNPFGGWSNGSECANVPEYPICSEVRYDNMRQLCRNTFAKGFRVANAVRSNPVIQKMCQVMCPDPLWQATGLRRADEKTSSYTCGATLEPSGGDLTRSMDCSKPTYAWDGTIVGKTFNYSSRVIPCKRDGYTRVNSQPTIMPSAEPTLTPPTAGPTEQLLCCSDTDYSSKWKTCKNAADPAVIAGGPVTNCSTCLAYQCIDWTAGSAGMKLRQQRFFERTGIDVDFGVGSYGSDPSQGGLCYRLSVQNTQRDLIVQVVNTGPYVTEGNFNLLMGDGGLGKTSACASGMGANVPQFAAPVSSWGTSQYGWGSSSACANLPRYPICGSAPADSQSDLCQWGFSANLRSSLGATPPVIYRMCQVGCPWELFEATGIHRWDEQNLAYTCAPGAHIPAPGFLSRYMDCGKPSFAWPNNVKSIGGLLDPNYTIVVPCKRDGYTRINVQPLIPSTIMPTEEPTTSPAPSPSPTNGTIVTRPPVATASKKSSDSYFTSPKWMSIGVAILIAGLFILIVMACEVGLRVTRYRQFQERIRNKNGMRRMA